MVSRFGEILEAASDAYKISPMAVAAVIWLPIFTILAYGLLLLFDKTRDFAIVIRAENQPIELITFLFLFAGGIKSAMLARRLTSQQESLLVRVFYYCFSVGFVFTAMEEAAWGQWFFGFDTPDFLNRINTQGEVTIHNIRGLHGKSEALRLAFGAAGLIGVVLSAFKRFEMIGAPLILLPWFLIIFVHAGFDSLIEIVSIGPRVDKFTNALSELVEMLIGISGFLFVLLNSRKIAAMWQAARP